MQAVCIRAYGAALVVMEHGKRLALSGGSDPNQLDREIWMSVLYPPGSALDNSPLHLLCSNDTCSFTWTGI